MAAQRPVSAATRVIGPHRGMAAPRLGERPWLVATAGAPRWQASPWRTAADSLKRFVCNALASARNHPLSG